MIENSTLKVGGNSLKVWYGNLLTDIGDSIRNRGYKIVSRNNPKIITNPTAKLHTPFILVVNFTVDTTQKYQLVIQGDYKERYKECEDGMINLTEEEMFLVINQNQNSWFKKE